MYAMKIKVHGHALNQVMLWFGIVFTRLSVDVGQYLFLGQISHKHRAFRFSTDFSNLTRCKQINDTVHLKKNMLYVYILPK